MRKQPPGFFSAGVFYKLLTLCCFILFSAVAVAQQVKGRVTDSSGKAVSGASILVKGTKQGTSTDANGEFQFNSVPAKAVLVISFIGLETKEVKVTPGKDVIVTLNDDATLMKDVVVTGFQEINKKKFTGAGVKLKTDDIKLAGATDASRLLEGRAAGVTVQNVSSTFGAAPKVRIRGATSINGDNKPLWVVDGVVLEDLVNISNDQLSSGDPTTLLGSSVAGINVNDIETFDILKDAAATALYGARAMNGVVVITTKKGKSGKPVITYTSNLSTQLKPSYLDYNIMNSAEQMSVLAALERNGYLQPTSLAQFSDNGVYGKMYDLLDADENTGEFGIPNTTEGKNAFLQRYAKANTDWFNILFRNSFVQEHSISISSGTDKSQSFFSASFYKDNGWTIADNVKRYTLNFRNNYMISNKLTAGFLTTASARFQRAPGSLRRTSNVYQGQYEREFDINPFSYAINTSRALTAYDENGNLEYFKRNWSPFNIIHESENNYININVIDLKLQGELGYKFNNHLKYDFVGALRYVKSTLEHQITEKSNLAQAYRQFSRIGQTGENSTVVNGNKYLYQDPDDPNATRRVSVLPYGGFYNINQDYFVNYDFRNSITYNNTFNDKHTINILVGQQVKYTDRQAYFAIHPGYQYDNGGVTNPVYQYYKKTIEANFATFGMGKTYDRFAAFYLNGQYTFDRRYNIYGTVRYDGSNKLGSSKTARWLPTWSFGGAWNVDEEKFAFNSFLNKFSYLKIRGSYGLTASLGPVTNSDVVLTSAIPNRTFPTERETVLQIGGLKNSDLTWEKNHQMNIGLDAGLFDSRIELSFDYYTRNSFDLISLIKTAGIGGEAYKAINYADMKAHGFDVMLSGAVIKRKDWGWKANVTFGYNTNKITNARNLPIIYDLVKQEGGNTEGYPVNSLFSVKYVGLNSEDGVPYFIDENGVRAPGLDVQSEKIANLIYSGQIDPKYSGGVNNTFNYKNLSLNVFVSFQGGNHIRLYPSFRGGYVDLDAMPKEFSDSWLHEGDEKLTNIPVISDQFYSLQYNGRSVFPYNAYNYSDIRVAKGDLIRLKSVSLSYNFTQPSLKKLGVVKNLSFTAAITNPYLIYADKKLNGQDPEFFNAGGVAQPIQKQITLSIKAGF